MSKGSRFIARVEGALGTVAMLSHRHPVRALLALAVVTMLSVWSARRLTVDADLVQLLPKTFKSVQDVEILEKRFGGVGYVVIVGRNAPRDALVRFAEDLAPKLQALDGVRYVDYQRPVTFFEEHALYFMDPEDLVLVRDRLTAREAYERQTRNPLYLDLEEGEAPSLEFPELEKKYKSRSDQEWMTRQGRDAYYYDADKQMIVLLVKPRSMSSDLTFAKQFVGRVETLLASVDKASYGPTFDIGLTGRFKKRVDQQALVQHDLQLASVVALILVVAYLVFHFRRVLAVGLLIVPLLGGLTWTYGFAGAAFSTLNILTAFIGAILMGLGIDHGIHLLGRFEFEMSQKMPTEEAVRRTFAETGRAVSIAALTTTVAFFGVGMSEFRAFREFGMIAGVGMILIVAAYATLLPAFLGLALRLGWKPHSHDSYTHSPLTRFLPRHRNAITLISAAVIAVCLAFVPTLRFNYDFNALEGNTLPSFQLDLQVNQLLGYSQTPIIVLTDTEGAEKDVSTALRTAKEKRGDQSTIDFVASVTDLVPPNQEAKQPLIQEIGAVLSNVKLSWLEPKDRDNFKKLRTMTTTAPFTRDDLPASVREQFEPQDRTQEWGFVLVFPRVSLTDGKRVAELANEVRSAQLPNGQHVAAAGEAMVLADILNMVSTEAPPVLFCTLIAVFLTIWILLGRFWLSMWCIAPAVATMIVTLGLLPMMGLELNYLNIVMIPVLFGIGVDGGVHIVTRVDGGLSLEETIGETGRAIVGAILTTALGFGAMMLADHKGLFSLGTLTIVGLAANLLACVVCLPAALAKWPRGTQR